MGRLNSESDRTANKIKNSQCYLDYGLRRAFRRYCSFTLRLALLDAPASSGAAMRETSMNSLRKILCFLVAMTFAAFALPGFAATKQFNVTLSAIAANGSMTATFNNLSTGNSVIKSES